MDYIIQTSMLKDLLLKGMITQEEYTKAINITENKLKLKKE